VQYVPLIELFFTNIDIANSRCSLSIGDRVEDRSTAPIFRQQARMNHNESFFKFSNQLGWQHIAIGTYNAKIHLFNRLYILCPLLFPSLFINSAADWGTPVDLLLFAEKSDLVIYLFLPDCALGHY
jgi:hypothetical protein